MALYETIAVYKSARLILPLVTFGAKMLAQMGKQKALLPADDKTSESVLDLFKALSERLLDDKIDGHFDRLPEPELSLANHHLTRFTGLVIQTVTESALADDKLALQSETLRLGLPALPECWKTFVEDGHPDIRPLAHQDFVQKLTDVLHGQGAVEVIDPLLLTTFFAVWLNKHVGEALTRDGYAVILAQVIGPRIGDNLAAALPTDHPAAAEAFRKSLLRFHAETLQGVQTLKLGQEQDRERDIAHQKKAEAHHKKSTIHYKKADARFKESKAFEEQTSHRLGDIAGTVNDIAERVKQPQPVAPAPKPKPIHLPYPSLGQLFMGRDKFMGELRTSLARQGDGQRARATAIVNAVHGLGGVGKTRLAVEYAWQHEADFSAVMAVTADTPESLQKGLADLCGPLVMDLPEKDTADQAQQVAAALAWLQLHPRWFLIIDNADSPAAAEAVETLLGKLHGGQVLITSRLGQWSGAVTPLHLDVLAPEEAARFLLERTQRTRARLATDDADAAALAEELGGLALALEQAGAYILQRRCSLAQYLTLWRQHDAQVQGWHDPVKMKYPRSVATTWMTTLDQLSLADIALLRLLAWMAPEPLPLWVLEGEAAEGIFALAVALGSGETIPATDPACSLVVSLGTLADFSMITWDATEQSVTIHRVVQEILRTHLPEEERADWLRLSLECLWAAAPDEPADVRTWPRWNPLIPHVAAAATHGETAQIHRPTVYLMGRLGSLLGAKALHRQAEDWQRRALAISERVLGTDHREVAVHLNNLAATLQATNRLAEAEPMFRRALEINEASYGLDHPRVATYLNNLAGVLYATNRLEEAEPVYQRVLKIFEMSYGPDHPRVANTLNNLAQLLKATNRLAEAEPMMRRALEIDETTYGQDHPGVAIGLNNLAMLLKATNRPAEAEPLMRRALEIDEASYGQDHPGVAIDLNNLAQVLQATNRRREAEPLSRRAVGILVLFQKQTGHVHPHFLPAVGNYVIVLKEMKLSDDEIWGRLLEIGVDLE